MDDAQPEPEIRSAGRTYLVLGLLAYGVLARYTYEFLHGILLVPAAATAIGALIGRRAGQSEGKARAYTMVLAGLWLLAGTALVFAAAAAAFVIAMSSYRS